MVKLACRKNQTKKMTKNCYQVEKALFEAYQLSSTEPSTVNALQKLAQGYALNRSASPSGLIL